MRWFLPCRPVRGPVPGLSLRALGRRLWPRLIERKKRVHATSFAGTFPALPQARSRHAWGATPRAPSAPVPRPSAWAVSSRLGAAACAALDREEKARPRRGLCCVRPCGTQEGGMASPATDRLLSRSKRPLPRKRADVLIIARAPTAPVPRLGQSGHGPRARELTSR